MTDRCGRRSWRARLRGPVLVGTLAVASLAGCGMQTPEASSGLGSPVIEAVGVSAFAEVVSRPEVIVLDVRTPAEFAEGHIPDSINIDVESPDFPDRVAELDKGATYAVYCRSGRRSAVAAEQLAAAGFTQVYDLAGGVIDWAAAGLTLVTN